MEKRIALVTGAYRGLGLQVSRELGRQGLRVFVGARQEEKGREAAARLQNEGFEAEYLFLDVTDRASIHGAIRQIDERFGRLDVLVNNAGILQDSWSDSLFDVPLDRFETVLRTNTFGPLLLIQAAIALMKRSGYGRIVNVASTLGSLSELSDPSSGTGDVKTPSYSLSKAALNVVTVLAARELRGTNILVNSCCPGWVKTDMGGPQAPLSVEEGADTLVWLATLPDGGPSGGFFRERRSIPW